MDEARQASIVYQNQSHLAFEILKHNSKGDIDPKEVVKLALKLTKVAVNPLKHMETLGKE